MGLWPSAKYLRDAKTADVPDAVARNALRQAQSVQNSVPAVLTLRHLAELTRVPYKFLRAIVGRRGEEPYRLFRIAKRRGGHRTICVPVPMLAKVQRWINRHILQKQKAHESSAAYAPGSTIAACASLHAGCEWLIKIDVQHFFESVSEIQVYRVFYQAGYEPLVAFELARLCTRVARILSPRYALPQWTNYKYTWPDSDGFGGAKILPYVDGRVGHLPQGAPTSPMLANLAVHDLDDSVAAYASEMGLAYSRYSDDLILSGPRDALDGSKANAVVKRVRKLLLAHGLRPNDTKTVVAPPGAKRVVLGLLVDGPAPRLTKEFRRRVECHLHFLRKVGPAHHAAKRGFRSILELRWHIEGLLAHARQIDREFADWAQSEADLIDWPV